ncbi:MAG: G5 domain-containing protein [Oscillospiraceae bacterium]
MTDIKRQLGSTMREVRRILCGRSLWACLLAISISGILLYIVDHTKAVYIRDGAMTTLCYTLKTEPEKILDNNGIVTMAFDLVDFSGFEGKLGVISIKRAFPVNIQVDGEQRRIMTTEITVGELLKQQGIVMGDYDTINIAPVLYLSPGDNIVIERVEVHTSTMEEGIPYEVVYKENSLLPPGRTRTLIPGKNGKRVQNYTERIVDGIVQQREMVGDPIIVCPPTNHLVLRGANVPVSKLDFGIQLDASGAPKHYKKVMTNQVCTGYSAGNGAHGASNMTLQDGHVAVRAHEIPYGTKLYITSADGSFVYGCAIAADTGTGLMEHIIDIDLFYETYDESCINGRKYLNVYILD